MGVTKRTGVLIVKTKNNEKAYLNASPWLTDKH